MGSKSGFNLFSLGSVDITLEDIHSSNGEEICLVERLFSSSLVAIVSLNAPRKLKVCSYEINLNTFKINICETALGMPLQERN